MALLKLHFEQPYASENLPRYTRIFQFFSNDKAKDELFD